jgi:Protein kinase domain
MTEWDHRQIGPYVLVSRIGSGPMGSVFVARQSTIQRTVAVKVFHSHLFKYPNMEAVFLQDIAGAADLDHPGVIPILDIGADGDLHFVVTRLIDAKPWSSVIADGRPVPDRLLIDMLRQLAQTMDYSHDCGVIHLNIKPQNVFSTSDGRVLLGDYGTGRMAWIARTRAQSSGNTSSRYCAPEVAQDGTGTFASDLYSFGVVAGELFSLGHSADPDALDARRVLRGGGQHLNNFGRGEQSPTGQVIGRMLSREPLERFQSAGEFVAALRVASETPTIGANRARAGRFKSVTPSLAVRAAPILIATTALSVIWLTVLEPGRGGGIGAQVATQMAASQSRTPTPSPVIEPSKTPDQETRWQDALAKLGAAWGMDWPGAIGILEAFRLVEPGHDEAKQKLYGALVAYGAVQWASGDPDRAVELWTRARSLLPGRPEAGERLSALTPTSTVTPRPTYLPTASVTPDPASVVGVATMQTPGVLSSTVQVIATFTQRATVIRASFVATPPSTLPDDIGGATIVTRAANQRPTQATRQPATLSTSSPSFQPTPGQV